MQEWQKHRKSLQLKNAPDLGGNGCFDGDGSQNYLIFQPVFKHF